MFCQGVLIKEGKKEGALDKPINLRSTELLRLCACHFGASLVSYDVLSVVCADTFRCHPRMERVRGVKDLGAQLHYRMTQERNDYHEKIRKKSSRYLRRYGTS